MLEKENSKAFKHRHHLLYFRSVIIKRQSILITHANPEDNVFARWLAARLIQAGYLVWVDVNSLVGGSDFWSEIEDQLRHHSIKQIVLVSKNVRKPGVQKELALGDVISRQLNDPKFLIPIRIDNSNFSDLPPELIRRNSLNAFPNWASDLPKLLETLQKENVPQAQDCDATMLRHLVDAHEQGRMQIKAEPEILWSNWFELSDTKPQFWIYETKGTLAQFAAWLKTVKVPHVPLGRYVATFCDQDTFRSAGDFPLNMKAVLNQSFAALLNGGPCSYFANSAELRKCYVNLMRQHWNCAMEAKGLKKFSFASGQDGWFFPDALQLGPVKFSLPDGQKISRVLSGKFKDKRWHLCLVARPMLWPEPMFRIHANVALSLNGIDAIPGDQTQKLRRRLTKSWWNNKWRDLLLAGVHAVSNEENRVNLAVGVEEIGINSLPISTLFPVSYDAEEERANEENDEGEIVLSSDIDEGTMSDDMIHTEQFDEVDPIS